MVVDQILKQKQLTLLPLIFLLLVFHGLKILKMLVLQLTQRVHPQLMDYLNGVMKNQLMDVYVLLLVVVSIIQELTLQQLMLIHQE